MREWWYPEFNGIEFRIYPHHPSIGMPNERKQELKTRLASVLWEAVEECVQRLDAEDVRVSEKGDATGEDWMTMLQPIQKDDQEQCEAWEKEVQNILIFAALFSAIVTAFLLESYQLLRDQTGSQDGTTDTTEPLSSSIRINVFWFLSFVLSLTTALIGIIAAQWLREHLSYPEYLTPEQLFTLLNMKISMLKKWHVRGIISSLSILLQISLLLFFAGLVQFLVSLEVSAVTIPVTVLISLSALLPIITTVLPALHLYVWQKETTAGGDVPVPCPYKSLQAELFYAFSIALSNHRPFPQLFSLVYALVTFIPTTLVTCAILVNFYLPQSFSLGGIGKMVLAVLSLIFKTLKCLSTAADGVLHYLHEVRSIHGLTPIHYNRTMVFFRPALKRVKSEYWWALDDVWVSIRRDYAFRLYASRAWKGKINPDRRHIMEEWGRGENDPPRVWGKVASREANARAGPPWDQIQGLMLIRHQCQHNDSNLSIMEAALRCFKASVSPFRAYDKADSGCVGDNSWMIGFEDATTEILLSHVNQEVNQEVNQDVNQKVITFAYLARSINRSSSRGLGFDTCTESIYHEALFHFLRNFHLEKLADKGEVRLKTAWVELYYKLVGCQPSSEDLQHIDVPFAFATCSKDVSSVIPQFSQEEEKGLQEIYLQKAKSCAGRFDKYRKEVETTSDKFRNQVLHDFFFAIGAPPFFARQDKVPTDIQKLVSSLSQFCQYLKQRHNPNTVNLADRIETAFGDTLDNYFEDSQIAFNRVAGLPLDYGATEKQVVPTAIQEMEPLVSGEDLVSSSPSHTSKDLVKKEIITTEPLVSGEDVMPPDPKHSSKSLVDQEQRNPRPLVRV